MPVTINGDGLIDVGGTSTTQGRVRLAEDTDNGSNYVELTAPAAVTSNRTITFPDATTTVVGTDATQSFTNKSFDSASVPTVSGTAPLYFARAWVNFNGAANSNLSGTYSQSGTTVTVTATAHGLIAGNSINADITSGTGVDGIYTVATVTDANTFTYTAGTSLTTSGNITLLRNTIRASGNVSSITDNGTGDYTVNFTTAMPDADYSAVCTGENTIGATRNAPAPINYHTYAAASLRIMTNDPTSTAVDFQVVNIAVFR